MAARALTNTSHNSQPLSLITSITSLLQTLNPQNPNSSNPNPSLLNHFSHYLNPDLVIQVIKHQTNPSHALFFFKWASNPNPNPNSYSHTHLCYVAITDILISHNLCSTAQSLLKSSCQPPDFIISKFIKAYGDHGDIWGAIHWFHRAKIIESGRCLYSYNAIIGVLVRVNRIRLAEAFFDQIVKEDVVRPDVSTYTTMIRGYCKMRMIENAKKVFDEMVCRPNLVTYNTIINGFCKKGLMESAQGIVNRMIESKDCLPDTVTFNTLIDAYCKRGELEAAMNCVYMMVNWNCVPNVLTYNAIINGLCMRGNVDEAKRMMKKMRLNGLEDDVATHASILKGLCIVGKSDDAVKHLKEMISLGMKPDVISYGVIVNEYCKWGKPGEAISVLKEIMKVRGIKSRVSSFNAVFRSLVESGELDRAILLLKQMPRMGCSPNFLSYDIVICSLCRAKGRMQEVEELVGDMLRNGHAIELSMYSCLVKGYCEDGNEKMAMRVFRESIDMSYMINLESFSLIVEELCGKGKVFEVEKLFEEMSRSCPLNGVDSYRRVLDEHLYKVGIQPHFQLIQGRICSSCVLSRNTGTGHML